MLQYLDQQNIDVENQSPWTYVDKDKLDKILHDQLSGDISRINPNLSLNQQANVIAYNSKYEIDRSHFTVDQLLGSGNFGSVYIGEASGLFHPGSKTKVAIKTVNDSLDMTQFNVLMCEMKILTNLDLHLNLVNLLGSCTSEMSDGKLWLLLEVCAHGDLKTFLINNRDRINNSLNGLVTTEFDSRLFLHWAYSVAKGMEYLSSKRIMHGDLAARNVLLGDNLMAKVGDFGLSKSLYYDSMRYKKQKRPYVPWKWMALEYLTDGCFALKSDVWSFGIVIWEIFSLGQEPYATESHNQSIESMVSKIKSGYRLSLPDEVSKIDWADSIFQRVVEPSWKSDVNDRISFSEIVTILESMLDASEVAEYEVMRMQYQSMQKLISDEVTASKRNTLTGIDLSPAPPGSYHKMGAIDPHLAKKDDDESQYVSQDNGSQYVSMKEAMCSNQNTIGYITMQQISGQGN